MDRTTELGKRNVVKGKWYRNSGLVPHRIDAVSDIIHDVSLPAAADPVACSVSNEAGVYYAQLYVPGHVEPMMVALHGVTSDSQAAQALESFAQLRAQCPPPLAA